MARAASGISDHGLKVLTILLDRQVQGSKRRIVLGELITELIDERNVDRRRHSVQERGGS